MCNGGSNAEPLPALASTRAKPSASAFCGLAGEPGLAERSFFLRRLRSGKRFVASSRSSRDASSSAYTGLRTTPVSKRMDGAPRLPDSVAAGHAGSRVEACSARAWHGCHAAARDLCEIEIV